MIYKFRIVSDEVDNFKREICIDSDASFLELHDAILDSVGFSKDQMTSFFICDDDWEKMSRIILPTSMKPFTEMKPSIPRNSTKKDLPI